MYRNTPFDPTGAGRQSRPRKGGRHYAFAWVVIVQPGDSFAAKLTIFSNVTDAPVAVPIAFGLHKKLPFPPPYREFRHQAELWPVTVTEE